MVYITGDTHAVFNRFNTKNFPEQKEMTKDDFVIVCGDFGGIWYDNEYERHWLKWLSEKPFTILYVDGNHENFDLLNAYPVEEWKGGKVHKILPNVIHLMRGQVFEIDGKTIFTFGGGTSVDKMYRTEGVSWWKQEIPSYEDFVEARINLARYNNKVDYIITHSCDERALFFPPIVTRSNKRGSVNAENRLFDEFETNVKYKHWYFGHYHVDGDINERKTVVYENVLPIE